MSFYGVVRGIFKYPLKLIFGVKVTGKENIPAEGGFVLAANHTSMCDLVVLAIGMRRQPKYMAKKEALSVPIVGAFLRSLGAFAVDRGAADLGAVKKAISIIEDGGVVGIFPQGHRYPKVAARNTPVRSGVGMIAYRAKCPILPVYIKTKRGVVRFFKRTEVIYGKPILQSELGFDQGGSAEYKFASAIVLERICALGVEAGAPLEVEAARSQSEGTTADLDATDSAADRADREDAQ